MYSSLEIIEFLPTSFSRLEKKRKALHFMREVHTINKYDFVWSLTPRTTAQTSNT